MDSIVELATRWNIDTEHYDGLGHHYRVELAVLSRILEAIGADQKDVASPQLAAEVVISGGGRPAFQGNDTLPQRSWGIAVQLYSIRSNRNWGHGDFTDLANLLEIASSLGAATIGLNPLHALFDDRANEASPYFPSSRLFLNSLYIDVVAIPEYSADAIVENRLELEALRSRDVVDYVGVAALKSKAFATAYQNFRDHGTLDRRAAFDTFRQLRGETLFLYASFELLRRQLGKPWWEWPVEYRVPSNDMLQSLQATHAAELAYFEFIQWIADEQLAACRDKAGRAALPIGLYLDLAVGVRSDGFDAWYNQDLILPTLEIGAPPDQLNTKGQRWGLAGINPLALMETAYEPFRQLLRASMRFAGAIRIDHILGLKRLYLIPKSMEANQGAYIHFPFETLLAIVAQESAAARCIVIGEDLGTVPPGFQDTLARWGIWSFQVLLFRRAPDGGFIAPDLYRPNALVTFATHDLPTFRGWDSGSDLVVQRQLGLDPGETDNDRTFARDALGRAMAWRGLPTIDYLSVSRFLADTPSRLMMVTLEDALGEVDRVNLPGTIDEHPNWRRRYGVPLEEMLERSSLSEVAGVMEAAGRGGYRAFKNSTS